LRLSMGFRCPWNGERQCGISPIVRAFTFLYLALLLFGAGCRPTLSILGKWRIEGSDIDMVTEFKESGEYVVVTSKADDPQCQIQVKDTGVWNKQGLELSMKLIDADWTITGSDKAKVEGIRKFFAQNKQRLIDRSHEEARIKWLGRDRFELKGEGEPRIYKRVSTTSSLDPT